MSGESYIKESLNKNLKQVSKILDFDVTLENLIKGYLEVLQNLILKFIELKEKKDIEMSCDGQEMDTIVDEIIDKIDHKILVKNNEVPNVDDIDRVNDVGYYNQDWKETASSEISRKEVEKGEFDWKGRIKTKDKNTKTLRYFEELTIGIKKQKGLPNVHPEIKETSYTGSCYQDEIEVKENETFEEYLGLVENDDLDGYFDPREFYEKNRSGLVNFCEKWKNRVTDMLIQVEANAKKILKEKILDQIWSLNVVPSQVVQGLAEGERKP
ncbi:hypothetical protein C2G38_2250954 [Gigaspora rosea]|uniref:Uncharacterized protein n=1 Tax=Gigaspora rosea TaxID=44941 RepID=A0A397UJ34_9GLOM|nr:hypothetical protein C2G38_2250954 [Gigaspora rosea]